MSYNGHNISAYVDQFATLFSQLDRMGKDAAIPQFYEAAMLLASIYTNCSFRSTAADLRTKNISKLTWNYVATTLIDECNGRQMGSCSSERAHILRLTWVLVRRGLGRSWYTTWKQSFVERCAVSGTCFRKAHMRLWQTQRETGI